LFYASEEAATLGTGTSVLGLLREEKSFAAELLREAGIRTKDARKDLAKSSRDPVKHEGMVRTPFQHVPVVEYLETANQYPQHPCSSGFFRDPAMRCK
jgi:hypothetical protein